ncbi:hypothetical protein CDD83_2406 [Cordyceps sp. RAO-2017]|nr:hypothetical protein CDD83_2406 [Cordyceps sp. RAO-2017]
MPPSQRRRRPADEEESEEDARPRQRPNRMDSDDEAGESSGDGMDVDSPAGDDVDRQLAKKLVRYAISCEYSRTPIRRDGIKERVLGNRGRSFKKVYQLAQQQLREVWGMELRELPIREKMSLQEKRQAMKSSSQVKTGSGAYILSSTLPARYRSASILRPSKVPSEEDEATYTAFYTLVVALIWLSAGELSEQKLKRHLMRLNADQNLSNEKTETTIRRMEKQGYVVKKVERPPVGQDGDQTVTWHVGPRAKEEIGLDGVMGMVREVYREWTPDLDKKLRASLGLKAQQPDTRGEGAAEASGNGGQTDEGEDE